MSAAPEASSKPTAYRALILLPDGAVADTLPLIAADDDEASTLAKAMVDGHAVELWDGLRFIEHYSVEARAP